MSVPFSVVTSSESEDTSIDSAPPLTLPLPLPLHLTLPLLLGSEAFSLVPEPLPLVLAQAL